MELGNGVGVAGKEDALLVGGIITIGALRRRNGLVENGTYEKRAKPCRRPWRGSECEGTRKGGGKGRRGRKVRK